ncbi:MAG: SDR family NAD(P)-dependent oxidoreductase [Chloroflexi bacterium]|nr:SDR family NAD(P)-dependent oxidoreductase [Chloroflexota bacterium]
MGVEYGPTFQGVKKLWRGEAAAWGEIRLAPEAGEASSFHLHPALLDAAFHVVGVALPRVAEGEGDVYLPVGMGRLTVYASGQAGAWARVTAQPGHETVTSDLELFDETGQLVAELRGLTLKRASRQALRSALGSQKSLADWFYETAWRPKALSEPKENAKGSWLVFAERGGLGEALAAQLKEQGVTCDVVLAGESFAALDAGRWQVNPARPEDFAQLRRECGPRDGVVYLWSADTDGDSPEAVAVSVLHLVQAMASGETKPGLWLVTRGAQTVAGKGHSLNQSPVWGLGKTIALEYPDLHCIRLDLDPAGETDEVKSLLAEVVAGDGEPQVARRNGARHAARLARTKTKAAQPFEFAFTSRGVLDNIVLRPLTRRQPGPGEVEIQVRASGLNFRDVLNVLGMYPGDPGIPGTECAGVVAAVGEGVADLKVGDSVVGVATGAFSSYAIARAALLAPKPDTMSFAEAATIPIAFMTALYGLKHLAKMKRGAKVLIHAAAGGVGLAAVQLAKQAGAEIFGTAGSPEKRAFLKSLGVQHIMSSRTLDFADEITKITGGQGVDIVLNALADDFITRSVSVLAEDGCFLEIGKRGIWTEEQMKAVKPGVTYFPYDLSYVLTNDVPLWQSMLRELIAGFASGALTTLPLHAFPAHEITDAFRFMAQARHTGKVVIIHHPTGDVAHENATYLITGGLGGLGLKVAQWMVGQGARHLALVGRSGAAGSSGEAVSEMERTGAQVKVFKADISQKEQVAKVLAEIAHTMPPLQGIVHAAGVLDDGMLAQQDRDRFARVLGPKVNGATALHELTHGLPLDFFVLFSSAASLLGAAGQGNYAAANAFMDALAHARQAQGLPALSLNWGAWSEVGMAAAQSEREQRRWASQGMGLISPDQGMQAFGEALRLSLAQAGILPIHWPRLTRQFNGNVPHLYQELAGESASADSGGRAVSGPDVMKQLEAAAPEERYDLLLVHVQEQVARVFGLDPAKPLDRRQALAEMGMDSLMSVELKNRLQSSLGRSLPTTLAFDHPTIEALAGYLATEVLALGGTPMMPVVAGNGDGQAEVAISVDELSDDEVNSMLNAMLADGGTQI